MGKIVNLESSGYSPAAAEIMQEKHELELLDLSSADDIACAVKDADAVITRLRFRLDEKTLSSAGNLKVVATATTGIDHIDYEYLRKRGIKLVSLKGEREFLDTVFATAEHTIALIMALMRNVPAAFESVKNGTWNRNMFKGFELEGKTCGIIGLGRLGTKTAGYFNAFGCRVAAADIRKVKHEPFVEMVTLDELLKISDIVSLHIDYNNENRHFINAEKFSAMAKKPWFINTSRGGCVDETALLAALKNGNIKGAALDVMEGELDGNFAQSPLINYSKNHDNLIITPHIGGATFESMEKTEIFIARKILEYL